MKSPAEMNTIQIEVTNACPHWCSNCTRFCGHYKKPSFMNLEIFKKAVDSLVDFPGMVGFMGGEPTLHPQFRELVKYYSEKIPEKIKYPVFKQPVKSFSIYRNHNLGRMTGFKRGLWTSLGGGYYKNFEQIQDVFGFQCINDHQNNGLHQALLITRKELGISDDEWIKLRDNCWIQNMWSASITPKGAFFCEVAAAFDMLFDGPGGWPIEPGWWKRKPEDFGDQLQWCELCSAPLRVPRIEANRKTDVISPVMLKKLQAVASPKLKKQRYVVFNPATYQATQYTGNEGVSDWYLPDEGQTKRVSDTNRSLCPKEVAVYFHEKYAPITLSDDAAGILSIADFNSLAFNDWVLVVNDPETRPAELCRRLRDCVLNPGCLYYRSRSFFSYRISASQIARDSRFILFNRRAMALTGLCNIRLDKTLVEHWDKSKRIRLSIYPLLSQNSLFGKLLDVWQVYKEKLR
ncbi:MAG: hypothetical protein PHV82_19080, partial [Victivallaceae bacterium]|nr:hypothetical protein [Victivallaceae bacterium]